MHVRSRYPVIDLIWLSQPKVKLAVYNKTSECSNVPKARVRGK